MKIVSTNRVNQVDKWGHGLQLWLTRKHGKIGHLGGGCQPRVNLVKMANAKKGPRLAHPHRFWGGEDPVFWVFLMILVLKSVFMTY
jgi:hypothetical protein